jgi:hypothetical protein
VSRDEMLRRVRAIADQARRREAAATILIGALESEPTADAARAVLPHVGKYHDRAVVELAGQILDEQIASEK